MAYVKRQEDGHWKIINVSGDDDPIIELDNLYQLIEHDEPHETWDLTKWKAVEHVTVQDKLKHVHRHYRMAPIVAWEPDRPTIIE